MARSKYPNGSRSALSCEWVCVLELTVSAANTVVIFITFPSLLRSSYHSAHHHCGTAKWLTFWPVFLCVRSVLYNYYCTVIITNFYSAQKRASLSFSSTWFTCLVRNWQRSIQTVNWTLKLANASVCLTKYYFGCCCCWGKLSTVGCCSSLANVTAKLLKGKFAFLSAIITELRCDALSSCA